MVVLQRLFDLSLNQNQKPFEKSLQLWLPELFFKNSFFQKQLFSKTAFCDFLAGNNNPDSPHSQGGGMKFATQISPLLSNVVKLKRCTAFKVSNYFR